MEQLDAFIGEIIEAKKLPGLSDEVKNGLIEDMRTRLLDLINRALIGELSDEQIDSFNVLMDQPQFDQDATEKFFAEQGIDTQQVAARTMLQFRDLYLNPPKDAL